MKKYVLTALLGVFGLFGFTSAVNVSCIEDGTCEPSHINNFSDNDNSYIFNISCSADLVLEDDSEYNLTNGQIITIPSGTTAEFVGVEDCNFSYDLYENNNGGGTYTVDGYTSDSEICVYDMSDIHYIGLASDDYSCSDFVYSNDNTNFYLCSSVSSTPYAMQITASPGANQYITDSNYCFSSEFTENDDSITFLTDSENFTEKNVSGKLYFSKSPITYSSSSGGSDSSDSSGLLSGGTAVFGGIISSLGSAVSEFIPYVAYIGLGLLGAIIGFVAIKRLINRVRAKIFGTFNSRRRK